MSWNSQRSPCLAATFFKRAWVLERPPATVAFRLYLGKPSTCKIPAIVLDGAAPARCYGRTEASSLEPVPRHYTILCVVIATPRKWPSANSGFACNGRRNDRYEPPRAVAAISRQYSCSPRACENFAACSRFLGIGSDDYASHETIIWPERLHPC